MDERDWQSIETAPKDGSWVLVFCDWTDGVREPRVARWVADHTPALERPYGPFCWATQDTPPNVGSIAERIATHWMPLPNPPSKDTP